MTDRIHVDDITQNHTPHGLLDANTQARLETWPHGVEVLYDSGEWVRLINCPFQKALTYRAIPAPLEKPSVDWSQIGPAVNHIAWDANGLAWGFECGPKKSDLSWFSMSGLTTFRVDLLFPSCRRGTVPWDQSLISRPGVVE